MVGASGSVADATGKIRMTFQGPDSFWTMTSDGRTGIAVYARCTLGDAVIQDYKLLLR